MALRKALAYSKKIARPYTRVSKNKSKSYIKVVPNNKIVRYAFGEPRMFNDGKFPYLVKFVLEESVQIRDNALESARMLLVKGLDTKLPKQYFLEIKAHPHHILRNNKTAAGAGADRLSSGMKHSFGIVEGRAAITYAGKELFIVACMSEAASRIAREIMNSAKAKIPAKARIVLEKAQTA